MRNYRPMFPGLRPASSKYLIGDAVDCLSHAIDGQSAADVASEAVSAAVTAASAAPEQLSANVALVKLALRVVVPSFET